MINEARAKWLEKQLVENLATIVRQDKLIKILKIQVYKLQEDREKWLSQQKQNHTTQQK